MPPSSGPHGFAFLCVSFGWFFVNTEINGYDKGSCRYTGMGNGSYRDYRGYVGILGYIFGSYRANGKGTAS